MVGTFDFFSYDEAAINKHLDSGQALCMVLHKDFPGYLIARAIQDSYILTNAYNDEERLVVAHGCYKNPVKRFDLPNPEVLRKCKAAQQLTDGIYPKKIFLAILEDPLCMVLNNALGTQIMDMLKEKFETFETEHEGETHTAIACVLYDPDYQTEGKIIAQWYEPTAQV